MSSPRTVVQLLQDRLRAMTAPAEDPVQDHPASASLEELRELASKAATCKKEWWSARTLGKALTTGDEPWDSDYAYIAAIAPETLLAILERLDAAEANEREAQTVIAALNRQLQTLERVSTAARSNCEDGTCPERYREIIAGMEQRLRDAETASSHFRRLATDTIPDERGDRHTPIPAEWGEAHRDLNLDPLIDAMDAELRAQAARIVELEAELARAGAS